MLHHIGSCQPVVLRASVRVCSDICGGGGIIPRIPDVYGAVRHRGRAFTPPSRRGRGSLVWPGPPRLGAAALRDLLQLPVAVDEYLGALPSRATPWKRRAAPRRAGGEPSRAVL